MTPKRRNYWDSETFPLVENRHVVGKLTPGKEPYERTMPMGEQARLEVEARMEAPPPALPDLRQGHGQTSPGPDQSSHE